MFSFTQWRLRKCLLGFLSGTFQKDWVSAIEQDEIPGYFHINVHSLNCKYSNQC